MSRYWSRYWTRIGLGIALVFALGMTARAGVKRGKTEIQSLLATASTRLPLQLAHLSFRLDGRKVGDVTAVEVHRRKLPCPVPEDRRRRAILSGSHA